MHNCCRLPVYMLLEQRREKNRLRLQDRVIWTDRSHLPHVRLCEVFLCMVSETAFTVFLFGVTLKGLKADVLLSKSPFYCFYFTLTLWNVGSIPLNLVHSQILIIVVCTTNHLWEISRKVWKTDYVMKFECKKNIELLLSNLIQQKMWLPIRTIY